MKAFKLVFLFQAEKTYSHSKYQKNAVPAYLFLSGYKWSSGLLDVRLAGPTYLKPGLFYLQERPTREMQSVRSIQ